MAEFLNQGIEAPSEPLSMLGKPVLMKARAVGYEHAKNMGLDSARAVECVNAVSEQLGRDKPYEAMQAGMRHLDLTGTYRLFAAILCASVDEYKHDATTPHQPAKDQT